MDNIILKPTSAGRQPGLVFALPTNRNVGVEAVKTPLLLQELPPARRQSMLEFRVEQCTP